MAVLLEDLVQEVRLLRLRVEQLEARQASSPLVGRGDLWGYSTQDDRIPIGTDDQVLTADSAEALGLKWATPFISTNYWEYFGGETLRINAATTPSIHEFYVFLPGENTFLYLSDFGTGPSSILVQLVSEASVEIDAGTTLQLTTTGTDDISLTSGGDVTVSGGLIAHSGHVGTDQSAAATGPVGTVVAKLPVYDNADSLLGYIPIYNSIT